MNARISCIYFNVRLRGLTLPLTTIKIISTYCYGRFVGCTRWRRQRVSKENLSHMLEWVIELYEEIIQRIYPSRNKPSFIKLFKGGHKPIEK